MTKLIFLCYQQIRLLLVYTTYMLLHVIHQCEFFFTINTSWYTFFIHYEMKYVALKKSFIHKIITTVLNERAQGTKSYTIQNKQQTMCFLHHTDYPVQTVELCEHCCRKSPVENTPNIKSNPKNQATHAQLNGGNATASRSYAFISLF